MVLGAMLALPMLWVAWSAVAAGLDLAAWRALAADPQLLSALGLSFATGLAATAVGGLDGLVFVGKLSWGGLACGD